jgi:hypothetical protein
MRGALLLGAGSLIATSAALYFFNRKSGGAVDAAATPATTSNTNQPNYPLNPTANIFNSISDGVMSLISEPRGIRNNNPLNIRWNSANNWQGQTGKDSGGFSIFDTPVNGIRAAARILDNYAKRGITTIAQIISTWAPAADGNNVEAYTAHVESAVGKSRNSKITRSDYLPLLRVMIKHENGKNPYTDGQLLAGINAA